MGDIGCELPAVAVLFLVLLGQVLHLVPNLLILSSNAPDQRAELLIGLALQRGLQVNAIDGLHHIPGRSGSSSRVNPATRAKAAKVGRAADCIKDRLDAWVTENRTTEPSAIRRA